MKVKQHCGCTLMQRFKRFKYDSHWQVIFCSNSLPLASNKKGAIDMIKPLSTVLSSAVNKSQHLQEKNSQREKFLGN